MGGRREEHALATFVSAPERPDVWDANFACEARASDPAEIEALLRELDARMAPAVRVRKLFCDPQTPPPLAAALATRGFAREGTVQLVLEGALRGGAGRGARPEIRRAESDADWGSVASLTALELGERWAGSEPPSAEFLRQFVGMRREMSSAMHMWIARSEGRDAGYFASWSGVQGMGMVEWLFCRKEFRRRGVATALLHHAVGDARERGAGPVLIGASDGADAVPRRLYAGLGFRPVCITEEYQLLV